MRFKDFDGELWPWFVEIIRNTRAKNQRLMKEARSNTVLLCVTIYDPAIQGWHHINPFDIDLRSGYSNGVEANIRDLLFRICKEE